MSNPDNHSNTPEEAHPTNEKWCCACDADVAFMEGQIEDSIRHFTLGLKAQLVAKKDLVDYDIATILRTIDTESVKAKRE